MSMTLAENNVNDVAYQMKLLASPRRLTILQLLEMNEEMSVLDLEKALRDQGLKWGQSSISNHLAPLRMMGIVRYEQHGQAHVYSLSREHILTGVVIAALKSIGMWGKR